MYIYIYIIHYLDTIDTQTDKPFKGFTASAPAEADRIRAGRRSVMLR